MSNIIGLVNDFGQVYDELELKLDKAGDSMSGELAMTDNPVTDVSYIDFNLVDGHAYKVGRMKWNDTDRTLNLDLDDNSVLQLGQEVHLYATNKTGITIPNGTPVYITGAQGNRPTIAPAINSNVSAILTVGLTTQAIANNATGYVTMTGLVRDVDTSAFSDGDVIWVDSTAGDLTNIRPVAPGYAITLGVVTYSHATNGIIGCRVTVVQRLAWLSDVSARDNQLEGDILSWNTITERWEEGHDVNIRGNFTLGDTQWDDLQFPAASSKLGINLKPDFDYTRVGLLFPQNNEAEYTVPAEQFSHSYKIGTDISPHVHFLQEEATVPIFEMEYRWYNNGTVPPAFTTIETNGTVEFAYTSGDLLNITEFPMIDGSHITGVSSWFEARLYRQTGDGVTGDVLYKSFDIHYEKDSLGSDSEYIK